MANECLGNLTAPAPPLDKVYGINLYQHIAAGSDLGHATFHHTERRPAAQCCTMVSCVMQQEGFATEQTAHCCAVLCCYAPRGCAVFH
jgi:hypothetical protein